LPLWAFVDALRTSQASWEASGRPERCGWSFWAVGTLAGALPGVVLALIYLTTVRPKPGPAQ
jgi:hypothetical protein